MTAWDDLGARARGLASRLLAAEAWEELRSAAEADRLAAALGRTPYAPSTPERGAHPRELERAVLERVARDVGLLARWAGPARREILGVIFLDLDRRALRVLARGALAGVPSAVRVRGVVPTPTLPVDRLEAAARAPTVAALAGRLEAWGHPLAPAVVAERGRVRPDLFRLETALTRLWAEGAVAGGRRGGAEMSRFVEESVDAANLEAVLSRIESPKGDVEIPFLEGGRWLPEGPFREALAAGARERAVALLRRTLRGSPLADALRDRAGEGVEEAVLECRVAALAARYRRRPWGATPVLLFVLRLQGEALALHRLIWSRALGAPVPGTEGRPRGDAGPVVGAAGTRRGSREP